MGVQKKVRKLVKRYKTTCPFELAERLNIEVSFEVLPDGVRGLYHYKFRRRFIVLNKKYSLEQQRFTCAHELGHDQYDRRLGLYFIEHNTFFNPNKYERRANRFAVTLLTYEAEMIEGETIEHFYARNNIPKEIIGKI